MDPRDSVLKAPEPRSATCMREREFWNPTAAATSQIAPGVAQMQLMLTKMRRQSLPCNTNQVSFDAKILHNLS